MVYHNFLNSFLNTCMYVTWFLLRFLHKEKLILNIYQMYQMYLKCKCFFTISCIFYTVRFFAFLTPSCSYWETHFFNARQLLESQFKVVRFKRALSARRPSCFWIKRACAKRRNVEIFDIKDVLNNTLNDYWVCCFIL